MGDDIAISAKDIGKAYRIWNAPARRLFGPVYEQLAKVVPEPWSRALRQRAAAGYRDFHALQDISFEVKKGEALGIIGRNGSGKSTLLQIIAGTLQPSSGTVKVNGRVAALLELGSGFNVDFTGRENVYLCGSVVGFSRREMNLRFDEIAAFADIGDFIDEPVKTYSTGMLMRLAFAVQIAVSPDILIVDEALSVGDVFFQQKCFQRIRELIASGVTLLFVSHDGPSVQNLCNRALLLAQGREVYYGLPEEAVSRYYAMASTGAGQTSPAFSAAPSANGKDAGIEALKARLLAHNILPQARSRFGQGRVVVRAAMLLSSQGTNALSVQVDGNLEIVFWLEAQTAVRGASFGIHLYDRMNECVFAAGARNLGIKLHDLEAGASLFAKYKLRLAVSPGPYTLSVGCSADSPNRGADLNAGIVDDRHNGIGPLEVFWPSDRLLPFYGKARLEAAIEYLEYGNLITTDLLCN